MKNNSTLRREARFDLEGRWGTFVLTTLLLVLFSTLIQMPGTVASSVMIISGNPYGNLVSNVWSLLSILVLMPMQWGFIVMFLRSRRGENVEVSHVFDGFRRTNSIMTTYLIYYIIMLIFCIPLGIVTGVGIAGCMAATQQYGMLAAVAVGVACTLLALLAIWKLLYKVLGYVLMPFVMYDTPLTGMAALRESERLMQGHRMQYFLLYLSFLGWTILAIFTLGIGMLWVTPYMTASQTAFYESIKADDEAAQMTVANATQTTAEEPITEAFDYKSER